MPTGETIFKIAEFLGVDAKWLMSGKSAESSTSPKHPDVCEITYPASATLRDEPYEEEKKPANPLTLEQRVEKLEAFIEALRRAFDSV